MEQTIRYLNHKITCSFEWVGGAGYWWRTKSKIPNYPVKNACIAERTLKELEARVKSTIDRWSE